MVEQQKVEQKIAVGTATLLNLGRMEGEEDETEDDSDSDSEDMQAQIVAGDMGTLRIRGQVERDRLLASMDNQCCINLFLLNAYLSL